MKKVRLEELSIKEKIGQMAVYKSPICQKKFLENADDLAYIGGVWVIGALDMRVANMNFDVTGEKIPAHSNWLFMNELNKKTKLPAIACMDSLRGIKKQFFDMSLVADSCMIGATGSEECAYKLGEIKAKELKCAGAKWLWGPEEDLPSRLSSISLGRKFSDVPELTIKLAVAENGGIQDQMVAATAKHFPGEDGLEYRDAHTAVSMMRLTMDKWLEGQGRVFQEVIDAGVYSVMVGHQSFPACDNSKMNGHYVPSSISYKVVTELLKNQMGFKGVVITDAIGMEGLVALFGGDTNRAAIACIKAGCDVILGCASDFIDVVEKAVLSGEIPESRIDDACQRVLDMKEKLGLFDAPLERMDQQAVLSESAAVNQYIAEMGLSLVCDNNKMLPLNAENYKKVFIIYSGFDDETYQSLEKYMVDEFKKHGVEKIHIQKDLSDRTQAETVLPEYDLILYVSELINGKPHGVAGYQREMYYTFHHATAGNQKGKRIGVSLGSPYVYFDYYAGFDCFINAYNAMEATQRAFVKALYGEIPFKGGHPFKLIPDGFEVNY